MNDDPVVARVKVNSQGRIVIPAAIREAAGIRPGDTVALWADCGKVIVSSQAAIWEDFRSLFAHLPPGTNLVDELIADRRAEAKREAEEHMP